MTDAEHKIKASKKLHYEKNKALFEIRNREKRERCMVLIQRAKDVPCMDCKAGYPTYVMDFDHRDPSTKTGDVTRLATHGERRVLEEIAKCDVVCANCHRERTHNPRL